MLQNYFGNRFIKNERTLHSSLWKDESTLIQKSDDDGTLFLSIKEEFSDLLKGKEKPPLMINPCLIEKVMNSTGALLKLQRDGGHWIFPLETDTTISSEFILLRHFIGQVDGELQKRLAKYILRKQLPDGGWSIYQNGPMDISASVKAYFALKIAGHSTDSPYMVLAKKVILENGGAEKVNVFTRITLALFGQIPWRTVPAMPIEIMLLPDWFFFNMNKVSYWSRTVIAPLLVIFYKKPVRMLSDGMSIRDLFVKPPEKLKRLDATHGKDHLKKFFIFVDEIVKRIEPFIPKAICRKALITTIDWIKMHIQGEGGLGAIYPAMANSLIMFHCLGYNDNDPLKIQIKKSIDDLIIDSEDETFCQPCIGPVWDTCLSLNALLEAGTPADRPAVQSAVQWLMSKQVLKLKGDWSRKAPHVDPGGWFFQFENAYYPDVDDTSMVILALLRAGVHFIPKWLDNLAKAVRWILSMQNSDGGWASFDVDNHYHYLNNIPFADHGALIDPSTSDITARCVELLSVLGYDQEFMPLARGIQFLLKNQEKSGAWYGRWGVNYIYGTWSVLSAFGALNIDMAFEPCKRAVAWLKAKQNSDGGWGESCASYNEQNLAGKGQSMPSMTAWALLGLMAVGEVDSFAVEKGVRFLLSRDNKKGSWDEKLFNGTGFPKVFYLRYRGYSHFFPLWALGVYHRLKSGEKTCQQMTRLHQPFQFDIQ